MTLICLCEVLDERKYQLSGKVAIFEDKKTVLRAFGLTNEKWLQLWNIDSRVLTLCFDSLDQEYEKFIVVFDYETFCSDKDVKEAILFHELGHIHHPVLKGEISVEAEIECDQNAIKNGYRTGILKVLRLMLDMAKSLNHKLLIDMTMQRLQHIESLHYN